MQQMDNKIVVKVEQVKQFVNRCMTTAGSTAQEAQDMADVLVAADHRGHYSHGLNRLGK